MNTPFFSIIIPTKDRDILIRKAIDSVLNQTFGDFELVIVDNSGHRQDKTQVVVETYQDSRLKYCRTGGLSMPDNWNFAYKQARGKYITVLTDRMYFIDDSVLQNLEKAIVQYPEKVITWKWAIEGQGTKKPGVPSYSILAGEEILQGFLDGGQRRHWFNMKSPKGLNTCLPNLIYKETVDKYGRLCNKITPDFTMAFLLLNTQKDILCFEEPMVVSGGMNVSTGKQSRKDKSRLMSYLKELGDDTTLEDTYSDTPIPIVTVFNIMYNDLFQLAKKFNWDVSWTQVNLTEYFYLIYSEIQENINEAEKQEDLERWKQSLLGQSEKVRTAVQNKIDQQKNALLDAKAPGIFTRVRRKIKSLIS